MTCAWAAITETAPQPPQWFPIIICGRTPWLNTDSDLAVESYQRTVRETPTRR